MGAITERRQLVERVERMARETPRAYRMRLALLALLGFGVILFAIALALGLSVGAVAWVWLFHKSWLAASIKLLWIPCVTSFVMISALWVRFDMPGGHRLQPDEAPALWAEIEGLRIATNAPRLDGVFIDGDLNAAAAVVPRMLGLLGSRHYLLIGLPLMQRLDPEEFRGVLAHEFGHFGGRHGRFGGWIYYLRASWVQLLGGLAENRSITTGAFVKFFEWYTPYFDAYSFVLRRQQEYEADATAARVAGAAAMGRALVRIETGAELLARHFWPELQRGPARQPEPPKSLLGDLKAFLRSAPGDDAALIERMLARKGDDHDSHPRLSDRLSALGVTPDLASPSHTAAEAFLGAFEPEVEEILSAQWHETVVVDWRERHAKESSAHARLGELEGRSLSAEEALERARLFDQLHDNDLAIATLREAVAAAPDDPEANGRLGELLLERDDPAGIAPLRRAIAGDPDRREALLALLDAHYARTGADLTVRDGIAEEMREARHVFEKVYVARNELSSRNRFLPHGLDEATLERLRMVFAKGGKAKRAWLVRKDLGEASRLPHYVFVVRWRFWSLVSSLDELHRILHAVALDGSWIIYEESTHRGASRKIRKVKDAGFYHRR